MASLSESSVVIALRDWHWSCALRRQTLPRPCVGLSGYAEYKFGDIMLEVNERLFLFEVKSTRARLADEWRKKRKKLAYEVITELAGNFVSRHSIPLDSKRQRLFRQSLQCHHFVYWDAQASTQNTMVCQLGDLLFTPYAFGANADCNELTWKLIKQCWHDEYLLAMDRGSLIEDPPGSIRFEPFPVLPLDAICSQEARLIERRTSAPTAWHHLGLLLPDFQTYVNQLCAGLEEIDQSMDYSSAKKKKPRRKEGLQVVVMSSEGNYFGYFTSTDDLKAIFGTGDPAPAGIISDNPAPTRQRKSANPSSRVADFELAIPANTPSLKPRPPR